MKSVRLIVTVVVLCMIAVSCQSPTAGGGQTQATPTPEANAAPATEVPAYPVPEVNLPVVTSGGAYPAPTLAMQETTLYPELNSGDKLEWDKVIGALASGQVTSVAQTHDLQVVLTLKDGRTLVSTEPAIDDIIKMVQQCGNPCKDIKVATE